jgi:hypothetical protein
MFRLRRSLAALAGAVIATIPASGAFGHTPGAVFQAYGTATIDGHMAAREWDGATRGDFVIRLPGGGSTPASVFMMNDNASFYAALRIPRATFNANDVSLSFFDVRFDNDHDAVHESGDDLPSIGYGPSLDSFSRDWYLAATWVLDTSDGGTNDVRGRVGTDATFTYYELAHPLNSADDRHDFSLLPQSRVGFAVGVHVCPTSNCSTAADTYWPSSVPTGDLIVASPPAQPPPPPPPAPPAASADGDNDGLTDDLDACPSVPRGRFDTNRNGCPGPFRVMNRVKPRSTADVYAGTIRYISLRIVGLPRSGATVVVRQGGRRETLTAVGSVARSRLLVGRTLRAGATVVIQATLPGWIGYHGVFRLHTSSPLLREVRRRCVPANGPNRPIACSRVDRGR